MKYTFDILGVSPVLNFFYYQQEVEKNPHRSKAYLGSYRCTLDDILQSTELIPAKPSWNWDNVVQTIVDFWLQYPDTINYWKGELIQAGQDNLIVARIASVNSLRTEFEALLNE